MGERSFVDGGGDESYFSDYVSQVARVEPNDRFYTCIPYINEPH
jgi:hypothetical protein